MFPFVWQPLQDGVSYLGFILKSNCYSINDWYWLVRCVEKRINNWTYCFLSLGGRLLFINFVLQSVPVYWLSMALVPKAILDGIRRRMFQFLWAGNSTIYKFHLSAWQHISLPKSIGGWGLKHLAWFVDALGAKTLWRALFGDTLWSDIIRRTYLKSTLPYIWIRYNAAVCQPNASAIWRGLCITLLILKKRLAWNVGRGIWVHIGIDPIMGLQDDFRYHRRFCELCTHGKLRSYLGLLWWTTQ